jgi:Uma2 family endonuclease
MDTDLLDADRLTENPPMRAPKQKPRYTVDEYLAFERAAFERHEYLDGDIIAMANESGAHADVSVNMVVAVGSQLKGKPCRARTKDTKVRSGLAPMSGHSTKGMFSYPDIVVICEEPEYHDAHRDIILNPKAIFEVLSPSTESFDRGEKFTRYQTCNPTLTDYVLVSQDKPQIEHFQKQADGGWSYHRYAGLDASVVVASIECKLSLADVYDRLQFSDE